MQRVLLQKFGIYRTPVKWGVFHMSLVGCITDIFEE